MTLEQQVTSLELSKKLAELGVKQESYFYYRHNEKGKYELCEDEGEFCHHKIFDDEHWIAAFTVAELGEMLPVEILNPPDGSPFWTIKTWKNAQGEWGLALDSENRREIAFLGTEADVRAKILIHLLENKLIIL